MAFITQFEILYLNQFGFRQKRSTSMAVLTFVEKIRQSIDSGDYSIGLFLDFSKAFDTINHNILLEKLEHYGFRGLGLNLIRSYLSNRTQITNFDGTLSATDPITCGVPQGSVLGPLFFLLYINDIYLVSPKLFFVLFADDTNILLNGKDLTELNEILKTELAKISQWLNANKLSLNVDKTHYIIFTSYKKRFNANNFKLHFNGKLIERASNTKFLGIIIDENLTWKPHIKMVNSKASRINGILYRIRHLLNQKSILTIYYSLIYSYLSYSNIIWGGAKRTHLEPLLKIQKRFARIATNSDFREHATPLFNQLKLLHIHDIFKLQQVEFMYKWTNNKDNYKTIFPNYFTANSTYHHHNTRQKNQLRLPKTKTIYYGQAMIKYTAPIIWNNLNNEIKDSISIEQLKNKFKAALLETYL